MLSRAVYVERDQLKDRLAQLECDHLRIRFENDILLYHARQRSSTITMSTNSSVSHTLLSSQRRTLSLQSISTMLHNEHANLKYSASLNNLVQQ
jgi:hypothetical protein